MHAMHCTLICALACSAASDGTAQATRQTAATRLIQLFEEEQRIDRVNAFGADGALSGILSDPSKHSKPRVDTITAALENVALSSTDPSARGSALALLSLSGTREPNTASVARLRSLYQRANIEETRSTIVALVPAQAHRGAVLSFLSEVARERGQGASGPVDEFSIQQQAVAAMWQMGDEGKSMVLDLHKRKLIRDGTALLFIQYLLRTQVSK